MRCVPSEQWWLAQFPVLCNFLAKFGFLPSLLFSYSFTLARYIPYSRLSSVSVAFTMACECQNFQALSPLWISTVSFLMWTPILKRQLVVLGQWNSHPVPLPTKTPEISFLCLKVGQNLTHEILCLSCRMFSTMSFCLTFFYCLNCFMLPFLFI